jgi:hypothetical protein
MSRLEKTNQKKIDLLTLAKSQGKRPSMKEDLGRALNNYTSKASHSYDDVFTNTIKTLRPDWFRARKQETELKTEVAN